MHRRAIEGDSVASRPTGWNEDEDITGERAADVTPIRQAVVVVHGMGSQEPVQTVAGFVKTALTPVSGDRPWIYYSRPAIVTDSFEARRFIAPELRGSDPQRHTEFFEYHWSYLMTGNKLGDMFPTTVRLLLRRGKGVPDGLLGAWRMLRRLAIGVVLIATALTAVVVVLLPDPVAKWIGAFFTGGAVVGVVTLAFRLAADKVASMFVDVTRYLDKSPRSYEARRAIRGGLVELLRRLHDEQYDRIVVVAHSLGAFIAYDALTSLWAEMHAMNAGALRTETQSDHRDLAGLSDLEEQADVLLTPLRRRRTSGVRNPVTSLPFAAEADATGTNEDMIEYQRRQFALWKGLRRQGNPWRITDLLTVGTPMTFGDLLMTRPGFRAGLAEPDGREDSCLEFEYMLRRGELVQCPPRSETRTVETAVEPARVRYGWRRDSGLEVLGSQSVFAAVRWTNVWFPVVRGSLQGDWFGGPLRPLFGPGIRDIAIEGNLDRRLTPAMAHTYYFTFEDDDRPGSIARTVRDVLALRSSYESLAELRRSWVPTDPDTGGATIEA